MVVHSTYTTWLPRVTRCPVNGLPDFIWVEVGYIQSENEVRDLYQIRKRIAKAVPHGMKRYMEEIVYLLHNEFWDADWITVRLMFNKHKVTYAGEPTVYLSKPRS